MLLKPLLGVALGWMLGLTSLSYPLEARAQAYDNPFVPVYEPPMPDSLGQPARAAQVQTMGLMKKSGQGWLASWPGVNWTMRVRSNREMIFTIRVKDESSAYGIELNGIMNRTVPAQSGMRTFRMKIKEGEHQIRVIRRNESGQPGQVLGFWLLDGQWLEPPAPSALQMEFLGDSFTVGLGNESRQRECSQEETRFLTDASRSFPVVAAQHAKAQWRIQAISGLGMVRNWNGSDPELNYRTFYGRALRTDGRAAPADARWRPQVLVVGLGTNDFSTPVNDKESWTPETLEAAFRQQYLQFVKTLRKAHPKAHLVLTAHATPDGKLQQQVQAVAEAAQASGQAGISFLLYQHLNLMGCLWHPHLSDHEKMAMQLLRHLDLQGVLR